MRLIFSDGFNSLSHLVIGRFIPLEFVTYQIWQGGPNMVIDIVEGLIGYFFFQLD